MIAFYRAWRRWPDPSTSGGQIDDAHAGPGSRRPACRALIAITAFAGNANRRSHSEHNGVARVCVHDASPSRAHCVRVMLCKSSQSEGVGNAGCPMHPQPRVRKGRKHTSVVTTVHRNHPAFPHAMVLTASFVLSPVIGLSCHRRQRKFASANLTPASRRQDHTTSPSAITALRQQHVASIASRPYVRDDRETPLVWDGTAGIMK